MNLAITIWGNRVSPVFDSAKKILICTTEINREPQQDYVDLPEDSLQHKVECLADHNITCLICGAISVNANAMVINAGIDIYPYITGDVNTIIECFLTGKFPQNRFSMPGCSCRRFRCRKGRNRGRNKI